MGRGRHLVSIKLYGQLDRRWLPLDSILEGNSQFNVAVLYKAVKLKYPLALDQAARYLDSEILFINNRCS